MESFDRIFNNPYIVYSVIAMILVIVIVLVVIKVRRRKKAVELEDKQILSQSENHSILKEKDIKNSRLIKKLFKKGKKALKVAFPGRDSAYKLPWYLMIGETGAEKNNFLINSGMSLPLGVPEKNPGESEAFDWWFLNKGVVLDVNSAFFRDSGSRAWEAFLQILLKNRSQRALDGIILVFTAKELFGSETSENTQINSLVERATIYYDRLVAAQKVLGLQLPVYILVSKCDQVSGFKSFCGELPEKFEDGIFGWSNPYKLETGYTSSWVGEAFQSINYDLNRTQMQILASDISSDDMDGIFSFPQEFDRLKEPLQVTLDHLFRKSVYQESFYFRGLYFCGDPEGVDLLNLYAQEDQIKDKANETSEFEELRGLIDETETVDFDESNGGKTFFLRDLFEKKIFLESRLARPTLKVFQWRGKASLIARAIILLVAFTWGWVD